MPTTNTTVGLSKTQVLDIGCDGGDQSPPQQIQIVNKTPQLVKSPMKVVNQNPMVPPPNQELPRIPVVPSAPSSKLKRSKSNRQFDNMVKVARQLGDNFSRPSMIKLYEEYLDNSSTHYEPDELDLKYYKNIKDIQ
jgi:hypothetical protein